MTQRGDCREPSAAPAPGGVHDCATGALGLLGSSAAAASGPARGGAIMATTLPKLDPRVKRTRELLQRAFLELIAERGFRAITVQDIAERATVNRATFYAHFVDKYALMDSIVREQFRQALAGQLP